MRIAAAKVRGFQGDNLAAADALAACAKHYCAYGAVTAGREYASVDISERTVLEVYMPPFAAAVHQGVASVMPAFTDLAGVPMTADVAMLQGWLRQKLGFNGVIISDYNAIAELINHGIAADKPAAAALALKAGVDIDMMSDAYRHGLPIALERGLVTLADIDTAVRRVLLLKEALGLFDDPYRRGASAESELQLKKRRQLAREVGARSIVMLKNSDSTLPLTDRVKRLALLGPLADASAEMRGPWWGAAGATGQVTVLEGLRAAFPAAQIAHAAGVPIAADDVSGMSAALQACEGADAIVLCVGEAATMSGEAASRVHLGLPGVQRSFCELLFARARQLNIPVIVVLFSGRPLVVPWLIEAADAVLAAWFPGSEAGNAIGDVLKGRVSPSGRTAVSWPRATGQVPIFFGARPTGRPAAASDHYTSKYLDVANDPQFPFGFGLTYGQFEYSNLRVSPRSVTESQIIEAQVDIANVGAGEAEETVFLFTHDPLASVARPLLELKAFAKIKLAPGARGSVALSFAAADLRFLGLDLQPVFEFGAVEVLVGPCADRSKLLSAIVHQVP
jgi:beta-glucosidase